MATTRRDFLRVAGLSALGLASLPVVQLVAAGEGGADGKRWAMAVDLTRCRASEGCRDCSLTCHLVHNVPEIPDPDQAVKWIWQEPYEAIFEGQEHAHQRGDLKERPFPVLCNHCENPPCTRVCPTQATFKREDGIVTMDYHRCIGCRYCMAACPYGARSFNFTNPRLHLEQVTPDYPTREKGVVEKCNFCAERLAEGRLPACVTACKHGALLFGDLSDPESDIRKALEAAYSIRRKPELGTGPGVYYLVQNTRG